MLSSKYSENRNKLNFHKKKLPKKKGSMTLANTQHLFQNTLFYQVKQPSTPEFDPFLRFLTFFLT